MNPGNSTGLLLSAINLYLPGFSPYILFRNHFFALFLVLLVCGAFYWRPSTTGVKAPFVGYCSSWEPPLWAQIRYSFSAATLIGEGYKKWRNSMFQISRYDGDILVLSRKYIDDLHNRPAHELSAIDGLIQNFGGRYSGLTLLREHDVGIRALQLKITPSLAKLCEEMKDELDYCLSIDMPPCQEWTPVPIQPLLLKAVERMIHRIFVGASLCRDPKWLDAAFGHADNVTIIQLAMRSVPRSCWPLLNMCLPFVRKYKACIRAGVKILIPEILRRRELQHNDSGYEEFNDLLQSMIEMTNPEDKDGKPDVLARLMLCMTAIAAHSTAASGAYALFDLVSRPEYIEMLREEALNGLRENEMTYTKQALGSLGKLDSFLRESQRHTPLTLLGFLRVVKAPAGIRLQDGTHVPYGTRICMTPHSIGTDPEIVPNAESFDGLRYYNQRCRVPTESNKHQYATTDKAHLHFGYGTWACPGRFMASDILKIILTVLLLRYDIRLVDKKGKPTHGFIHEFPFVNPQTPLLIRRRGGAPMV
ncbi:P450 monooxygenase [Thozetella sp. PMI_491]|nr:P450 monooxygenase [Thozetella sp. PMI_491]